MSSSFSGAMDRAGILPAFSEAAAVGYSRIYSQHCHRIYSLAFWMTDNELVASDLASSTFLRAFSGNAQPGAEQIDAAFLIELRDYTAIGNLTLDIPVRSVAKAIRGNVKRTDLERAVVQLPATERLIFLLHDVEGYDHEIIGRQLGLTVKECQFGLHQARVCLRQRLAGV